MSRFDNTVNSLLNRLIFEQINDQMSNEEIQKAQEIIEQTRNEVKNNFDRNPEEFIQNADNIIDSIDGLANGFIQQFQDLYEKYKNLPKTENLTEQAESDWLKDVTSTVTDYAIKAAKTAGSYIGGAFEDVLDFMTDKVVENMPSFLMGVMGDQNYNAIRSEVDGLEDNFFYKVAAIFDPSGILSWTYLENARTLYEQNLGTEDEDIYTLNLLGATVAVIPGISALKIFTLPFKILSPLKALLGGARASAIARSVAKDLKGALNIGQKIDRGSSIAARSGRIGSGALSFAKNITKPVKPIAKLAASAAKAGTIIASGDIPKTLDDWQKRGAEMVNKVSPPKTFTRIPSFQRLSTQD